MTIAVAINVHAEPAAQIRACFSRVANNLPSAHIGIFCNGQVSDEISDIAQQYRFTVIRGENLASNSTWQLWWLRMLYFFRDAKANVCFKFDPDTMVDAPPRSIPNADYFGCLGRSLRYGIPFIQGGVTGLSARAASALLDSNLLSENGVPSITSELTWDSFADDQHLALILSRLGFLPSIWSECKSIWKVPVINDPIEFSIVHPRYYK